MSSQNITLPPTTRQKLEQFQVQVRKIKIAEGILAGLFGLAVSLLIVFILDRFVDTPASVRAALLVVGALGFGIFFPLKCHRWVWGTRRMEQVAKLLKHKYPALGDQLLGVVELARRGPESGSSSSLAQAAVTHVDEAVRDQDFSSAVPNPRHKMWAWGAAIPVSIMLIALAVVPDAGINALKRWMMPWASIDRYTFAQVTELPEKIIVPHGEEFEFNAQLSESTKWTPASAAVHFKNQSPVTTKVTDGAYQFLVPAQTETGTLNVRIGDIRDSLDVQVATRPELAALSASIKLPDYLQYSRKLTSDARSGVVSVLKGSVAEFSAEVSRELQVATVDGKDVPVEGATLKADPLIVQDSQTLQIQWKDELGLTAKDGFQLKVKAVDDDSPRVSFQQLDPLQVVLSTDVISFDVQADDDFGLKEIGLEWNGIEDALHNPTPDKGAKPVSRGTPETISFSGKATFCAVNDNVPAQTLEIQAYAEDFDPEKGRSYSPKYVIHVLTPDEHAIWISNQLRRWASLADDVYEEEMRLHDANRELRRMDADELNTPGNRRKIEQQAAAERANGQRLNAVTNHGDQLIKQALRNKEMLVGHLESWADALEALKEIGDNRMPSVADMLDSAARAPVRKKGKPSSGDSKPTKPSPMAGNNRSDQAGEGESEEESNPEDTPSVPKLTDVESGFMKSEKDEDEQEKQPPSAGKGKLSLPTTVLNGGPKPESSEEEAPEPPPASEELDAAVEEQADLLDEFARVREDLQKIMDDLDNSTFVKRLKSASRKQMDVAENLNRTLFKGFGVSHAKLDQRQEEQSDKLAAHEEAQSRSVWMIQSDLEAYYDRRKSSTFLKIIDEMEEVRVATKLTNLGDRIRRNMVGESIARAEYWSDTLDRWAEQMVEPAPGGS